MDVYYALRRCSVPFLRTGRLQKSVFFGGVLKQISSDCTRLMDHVLKTERSLQMNNENVLALSAKDTAKALGISDRYLWNLTKDGVIPCIRLGSGARKKVLYPVEALRQWMNSESLKDERNTSNAIL